MSDLQEPPCPMSMHDGALALTHTLPPGEAADDYRKPGDHEAWVIMRWMGGLVADITNYNCEFHAAMVPINGLPMLELHERMVGLPDGCAPSLPEYPQARLDAVVGKYRQSGINKFAAFETLARAYGYDVKITGHHVWDVCGNSVCEPLDCGPYWVEVVVRDVPIYLHSVCDNTVCDSLGQFDIELIRCVLLREMPSHWQVTFAAEGEFVFNGESP